MSIKWTDRVRRELKAKGYRFIDLAEKLNVTKGVVSHYLNGIREPNLHQVKEIAKMLNMSVSELLGDDAVLISDEKQIEANEIIKSLSKEKQEIALSILRSLKPE